MLSGDNKWGAFYGCEAFVLPSHQENFGIAIVEALACGKPTFITDKVNIWIEIEKGGGGIVNDDTIEGTIKSLMTWQRLSDDEKSSIGESARAVFLNNFSIVTATKRMVDCISIAK